MRAVGAALIALALLAGLLVGRQFAPAEAALGPSVVSARVAGPSNAADLGAPATRQVPVGVTAEQIVTDARALLARAATQRDPAAAAYELLPVYALDGPSDSCADGTTSACPTGAPANLSAGPVPAAAAQAESAEVGRPPTAVYAVTPDLIAVSVAHRDGENVTVLPNAFTSGSPACDAEIVAYDRLAHRLFELETVIDPAAIDEAGWDPAFASRTTVAFDIGEGLSMTLCSQVIPRGSREPNYLAAALVQTADRLMPTISLTGVTGFALPGWEVVGYLPDGQQCGVARVPTVRTYTAVAIILSNPRTLCSADDGSAVLGSGVLQFSRGDNSTFTIAHSYALQPAEYTSLALGAPALCRGSCVPPPARSFAVRGSRSTATVSVVWAQGSTNGAVETTVGAVRDAAGGAPAPDAPAPPVTPAPAALNQVNVVVEYRVNSDAYSVGASRTAAFLTVLADGTPMVGPHAGQCFGDQPGFDGQVSGVAFLRNTVHLSGSVQTVSLVPDVIGCVPDWPTSPLAITFSTDVTLDQLREGVVLRVDQPVGADPAVRATASAIVRISLGG